MFTSRLALTTAAVVAVVAAAVSGCGPQGNPPALKVTPAYIARVSSSIAEGAELTGPVRWQARVTGVRAGGVVSVRFLIDGKVRHLEREAPYLFAAAAICSCRAPSARVRTSSRSTSSSPAAAG